MQTITSVCGSKIVSFKAIALTVKLTCNVKIFLVWYIFITYIYKYKFPHTKLCRTI